MTQPLLLKVYANFTPASAEDCQALADACASAIASEDDHDPFVTQVSDMVRISFEGLYFPIEDVEPILHRLAESGAKGKLDVLDMENWRMTRYLAKGTGSLEVKSVPLNHVLDYSGH